MSNLEAELDAILGGILNAGSQPKKGNRLSVKLSDLQAEKVSQVLPPISPGNSLDDLAFKKNPTSPRPVVAASTPSKPAVTSSSAKGGFSAAPSQAGVTLNYLPPNAKPINDAVALSQIDGVLKDFKVELDSIGTGQTIRPCGGCGKTVGRDEESIVAINKRFHTYCFRCINCKTSLTGAPYVEWEGVGYCIGCHRSKFGVRCSWCEQIIEGEMVTVNGRHFHPEHFRCTGCTSILVRDSPNDPKAPVDFEGRLLCRTCYINVAAVKCVKCLGPAPEGIEAIGKRWHKQCFTCHVCSADLTKGAYNFDGQIYCRQHVPLAKASV